MHDLDILHKVTLLGILKKKPHESLDDVLDILVDTGMYDTKEGREVFAQLKSAGYITDSGLSMVGSSLAMRAEQEFKQ